MEVLKSMVMGIAVAAILGGAAMCLVKESGQRRMVSLAVGLMLALSVLSPLVGLSIPLTAVVTASAQMEADIIQISEASAQRNQEVAESSVTGVMIDYMVDRAAALGVKLTAQLQMATDAEGVLVVKSATLTTSETNAARVAEVQQMLAEECGIAQEKQQWIWE